MFFCDGRSGTREAAYIEAVRISVNRIGSSTSALSKAEINEQIVNSYISHSK